MPQGVRIEGVECGSAEAEVMMTPAKYTYEYSDFLTEAPYAKLYEFFQVPFVMNRELIKVADRAKEVGFRQFKSTWKDYLSAKEQERRQQLSMVPNQTSFDDQLLELNCGSWEASDFGIFRRDRYGAVEYACTHPIMPVQRLVNIDTGEVKIRLAYKRPGRDKKWQFIIVGKDITSDPKALNKTLSAVGVSVNQKSAPVLMEYLTEVEDSNYDAIPESRSIGRLGYIEGEGFSPYVDNLVFDGDAAYRHLYEYIRSGGSQLDWYDTALECRKMSVTARIFLAASFASPLLSVVGALPFFVHAWGGSGTGKTVALMLAASVWGDPLKGRFLQTFNATRVGQELTAAFLNQLPMCIDELQLTKNGKGQSSFDVYQLAEGVGRSRGKKSGGVELVPTWDCCFLTTGEDPIIGASSGGGAVNRVIEIECSSDEKVIEDAPRIAASLKKNFGWAGQMFVENLYKSDDVLDQVRTVYQDVLSELNKDGATEKQALAASAVLTADMCATAWIFKDGMELCVDDVKRFLASKEAVSTGARAYSWLLDWVDENQNHFFHDTFSPTASVYGAYDECFAYINPKVVREALNDAGFNYTATMSELRSKGLIATDRPTSFTKTRRLPDGSTSRIWLRMPKNEREFDENEPLL